MKKIRFLFFAMLMLFVFHANATNKHQPQGSTGIGIGVGVGIAKVNNDVSAIGTGGNAEATGGNGGKANNNLSINTPHQWPSSFVSGYSSSSPAGCRTGLGVQGGYGGVVLPLDDEDCELAFAAQMALSVGDTWGYCKLMAKTEAYEIANITIDDCFARNGVNLAKPSGFVTEPPQSYKDIPTPALDRLNKR